MASLAVSFHITSMEFGLNTYLTRSTALLVSFMSELRATKILCSVIFRPEDSLFCGLCESLASPSLKLMVYVDGGSFVSGAGTLV